METAAQTEISCPEATSFKFGKSERLRYKSLVDGLFSEGKSIYEFPLRAIYRIVDKKTLERCFRTPRGHEIGKVQVMITVPKKKRRHAVDRVLLRRRIREAYRLNRRSLKKAAEESADTGTLSIALVYIHTENLDYRLIEKKTKRILAKIERRLTEKEADIKTEGESDDKNQ